MLDLVQNKRALHFHNPFHLRQLLEHEPVVSFKIFDNHFQKEIIHPADRITFDNLIHSFHGFLETLNMLVIMSIQGDITEYDQWKSDLFVVYQRNIVLLCILPPQAF